MIKYTSVEETKVAPNPDLSRHKLPSCSADSRASDSGISAEFNEFSPSNGVIADDDVEVVEADGAMTEVYISDDDERRPERPPTSPIIAESLQLPDTHSSFCSPSPVLCDDATLRTSVSEPASALKNTLSPADTQSSKDSSPGSPAGRDVIANILEHLINDHLTKDKNWEPSGRYSTKEKKATTLVQMEADIGNTLCKKHKAREDARRVLEMFLESSLSADPNFGPSGRYPVKLEGQVKVVTLLPRSDSPSPRVEDGDQSEPSAEPVIRRLSPIIQDESALERSGEISELTEHRNSYYSAVYDGFADDECLESLTEAITENITAVYTPESFIPETPLEDASPISLIPLGESLTSKTYEDGKTVQTEVEATDEGIHIHQRTEVTRPLSSSTSLSSILDDGGVIDLGLKDRKKKSFFTRASERLRHALNRLQRADSRSESETEKYSVRPRPKKKKKKKGLSIRKKKGSTDIVDVRLLQQHQHKFELHGTAQIEAEGNGLNANIWREDGRDGDMYRSRVVNKGKASTLPTNISSLNGTGAKNKAKNQQKLKEKRDKEMKEFLKEAAKRNRKAADRSESSRSSESIRRMFSIKKPSKLDSPSISKSEKKPTFSLSSIGRRFSRKKNSMDMQSDRDSPQMYIHDNTQPCLTESKTDQTSDLTFEAEVQSAGSLQVPQDGQQQRSKSAEEIPSPSLFSHSVESGGKPSFRPAPCHSRSRSAQDTSHPFTSNASSAQLSSPQSKSPGSYKLTSAKSVSPSSYKKYVPRSSPSRTTHTRRHTTQVDTHDMVSASGASRSTSFQSSSRRVSRSSRSQDIPAPQPSPRAYQYDSGGGLAPAGKLATNLSRPKHGDRENLNLPLNVDATVNRTHSLNTRKDGQKMLHTVTSLDEMVYIDRSRQRKPTSELETDSEIERISSIPASDRSELEKDKLYRHIADKISKLVRRMENDEVSSSAYNTPMEDNKLMYIGNIPAGNSSKSSSLGRASFVSARSTSSTSPHGHTETLELSAAGAGPITGIYKMEEIPESERVDGSPESYSETAVTKTDVKELSAYLKIQGDRYHASNPQLGAMLGGVFGSNLSKYEVFEQVVDNMNDNEVPYIKRIASVFGVTLKALQIVGKTGELANRVKENALTYIENKFAQYIIGNGGWDSMLEESSSELEVD